MRSMLNNFEMRIFRRDVRHIYVIVIARGQGFMAVNQPSTRAQPEDKVCLRCHKSLATRAITTSDMQDMMWGEPDLAA